MSEWQPIDMAPKDGTALLLHPAFDRLFAVGRWAWEYDEGVWYMDNVGHLNGIWKPTHWMHLPKPPETSE